MFSRLVLVTTVSFAKTIDVKKFFLRFFILVTFFYVFNVFLFSKRFLFKKRWQSSERQAD